MSDRRRKIHKARGSTPARSSSRRRSLGYRWVGGGVVAAIALVAILSSIFSESDTASGEIAPDITWATATGEFQLSERRGEALLLYFSFPG